MPRALPAKLPSIRQSSTSTVPAAMTAPPVMRIPFAPVSTPLKLMLRRRTVLRTSAALKLSNGMFTPLVPLLRIEAKTSWQSMVIDVVMVTAPKPPGSRQLISPFSVEVHVATRVDRHGAAIEAEGFHLHPISWRRGSLDPRDISRVVREVRKLYRTLEPR